MWLKVHLNKNVLWSCWIRIKNISKHPTTNFKTKTKKIMMTNFWKNDSDIFSKQLNYTSYKLRNKTTENNMYINSVSPKIEYCEEILVFISLTPINVNFFSARIICACKWVTDSNCLIKMSDTWSIAGFVPNDIKNIFEWDKKSTQLQNLLLYFRGKPCW